MMIVGDATSGKTTLVDNLTKKFTVRRQKGLARGVDGKPLATEGADILDWEYPKKGTKQQPQITFYMWDFAGQVSKH